MRIEENWNEKKIVFDATNLHFYNRICTIMNNY